LGDEAGIKYWCLDFSGASSGAAIEISERRITAHIF